MLSTPPPLPFTPHSTHLFIWRFPSASQIIKLYSDGLHRIIICHPASLNSLFIKGGEKLLFFTCDNSANALSVHCYMWWEATLLVPRVNDNSFSFSFFNILTNSFITPCIFRTQDEKRLCFSRPMRNFTRINSCTYIITLWTLHVISCNER